MILYDTCIRAFVKGNLGDDLFIHTLCNRYPDTKFVMCGEKQYAAMFSEHNNLRYISTDSFVNKWLFRMLNIPMYFDTFISKLVKKKKTVPEYRCLEYLSRHSRHNILISGSIFMEVGNSEFSMHPYYKNEKKYFAKKPVVIGCNFGPYHSSGYREFYDKCFDNAKQVCFRDKYSYSLFIKDNTACAPDILFSYDKKCMTPPQEKDYVLISVMNLLKDFTEDKRIQVDYESAVVSLINKLQKENERIVLLGFCSAQGDDRIVSSIFNKIENKESVKLVNYPDIPYKEAVGYIANAKAVIATRYHAMILGWLYNKPVLPIVYSEKMEHVIEDLEVNHPYVTVEQLTEGRNDLFKVYSKVMETEYLSDVESIVEMSKKHFDKLDEMYCRIGR